MVEITYHREGDYYIPDLYLEKENYKSDYQIGKYGHLRLQYLKEHKNAESIQEANSRAMSGCAKVPPSYFPLLETKPIAFVSLIHLDGLIVNDWVAESFLN